MPNHKTFNGTSSRSGYAIGGIRWTLRLEGLTVLVVSVVTYWQLDGSWWWFFGLLLWPDLVHWRNNSSSSCSL